MKKIFLTFLVITIIAVSAGGVYYYFNSIEELGEKVEYGFDYGNATFKKEIKIGDEFHEEKILLSGIGENENYVIYSLIPKQLATAYFEIDAVTNGNILVVKDDPLIRIEKKNSPDSVAASFSFKREENENIFSTLNMILPVDFEAKLNAEQRDELVESFMKFADMNLNAQQTKEAEESLNRDLTGEFELEFSLTDQISFQEENDEGRFQRVVGIILSKVERTKAKYFGESAVESFKIYAPEKIDFQIGGVEFCIASPSNLESVSVILFDAQTERIVGEFEVDELVKSTETYPCNLIFWDGKDKEGKNVALEGGKKYYMKLKKGSVIFPNQSADSQWFKVEGDLEFADGITERQKLRDSYRWPEIAGLSISDNRNSDELKLHLVNPNKIEISGLREEVSKISKPNVSVDDSELQQNGITLNLEIENDSEPYILKINVKKGDVYLEWDKIKTKIIVDYGIFEGGKFKIPLTIVNSCDNSTNICFEGSKCINGVCDRTNYMCNAEEHIPMPFCQLFSEECENGVKSEFGNFEECLAEMKKDGKYCFASRDKECKEIDDYIIVSTFNKINLISGRISKPGTKEECLKRWKNPDAGEVVICAPDSMDRWFHCEDSVEKCKYGVGTYFDTDKENKMEACKEYVEGELTYEKINDKDLGSGNVHYLVEKNGLYLCSQLTYLTADLDVLKKNHLIDKPKTFFLEDYFVGDDNYITEYCSTAVNYLNMGKTVLANEEALSLKGFVAKVPTCSTFSGPFPPSGAKRSSISREYDCDSGKDIIQVFDSAKECLKEQEKMREEKVVLCAHASGKKFCTHNPEECDEPKYLELEHHTEIYDKPLLFEDMEECKNKAKELNENALKVCGGETREDFKCSKDCEKEILAYVTQDFFGIPDKGYLLEQCETEVENNLVKLCKVPLKVNPAEDIYYCTRGVCWSLYPKYALEEHAYEELFFDMEKCKEKSKELNNGNIFRYEREFFLEDAKIQTMLCSDNAEEIIETKPPDVGRIKEVYNSKGECAKYADALNNKNTFYLCTNEENGTDVICTKTLADCQKVLDLDNDEQKCKENAAELSDERIRIIFVPLNWQVNEKIFEYFAQQLYEYFANATTVPHKFKLEIVKENCNTCTSQHINLAPTDTEVKDKYCSKIFNKLVWREDKDKLAMLTNSTSVFKQCVDVGGYVLGNMAVATMADKKTTAHELGHTFNFCEEYFYPMWYRQNKEWNCVNPYPKCCPDHPEHEGKNSYCLPEGKNSSGFCRGAICTPNTEKYCRGIMGNISSSEEISNLFDGSLEFKFIIREELVPEDVFK